MIRTRPSSSKDLITRKLLYVGVCFDYCTGSLEKAFFIFNARMYMSVCCVVVRGRGRPLAAKICHPFSALLV